MLFSKNIDNRNSYIELCRFIACYLIFSFHSFGIFTGGWIMVEFFYMLSGYFTMKYMRKNQTNTDDIVISYPFKKLSRIMPYALVGIILNMICTIVVKRLKGKEVVRFLEYAIVNVLFLPLTGVLPYNNYVSDDYSTFYLISYELWYVCTLFVAIRVMILIVSLFHEITIKWLSIYCPFLIYGYIIYKSGTIVGWHEANNTFLFLNLRALAGVFLGGAVFYLSEFISQKKYTKFGKFCITFIEIVFFLTVCVMALGDHFLVEILAILFLLTSLSISFSMKSYTSLVKNKVFNTLGSLSLPIYCLHQPIRRVLGYSDFLSEFCKSKMIVFVICMMVSLILMMLIENGRFFVTKMKSYFICE